MFCYEMRWTRALLCFFTAVFSSTIAFVNTDGSIDEICPDPFVFVGDKCYWFYRGYRPFTQAQAKLECRSVDSRLVHVPDVETHRTLKDRITNHEFRSTSYWIGLSDTYENGTFRYTPGTDDAEFTAWADGQPGDSAPGRKCVIMSANFAHDWEAVVCFRRALFICEKEVLLSRKSLLRATNDMDSFCDYRSVGYYADPTNCRGYILCFSKQIRKYSCPDNEIFNRGNLLCENEEGLICETENEATTSVIPFPTEQPSTDTVEDDIYGANYEDEDIYTYGTDYEVEEDVIEGCEEVRNDEEETGSFPEYTCGDGYTKLGKKCYKVSYDSVSWNVANQICIGEEVGRLVMIKSKSIQQFLNRQVKRSNRPVHGFWIGLNDQETENVYVWSDGSILCPWSYMHWSVNSRKRYPSKKKCVQMRKKRGLWDDNICSIENGYICEKDAVNPDLAPVEKADVLPSGWKSRNSLCGTNRRPNAPAAVIGGTLADISEHPWQVSFRSLGHHTCGGTLIDNCWILTAAHCVDPRTTGPTRRPTLVVLGDVDTSVPEGTEKFLRIEEVILHPTWTANPVPSDDIALVKLQKCADDLNPICLPGRDFDEFEAHSICKVTGWGTMDADRLNYPNQLQEANIPIISQRVCKQKYRENGETLITDEMLCAGYLRGGVDACQGDSGGPLACKGVKSSIHAVQWGIVSWGFGCARRDKPGVYTKVARYMDWIRNHTKIDF